MKEKTHTKFFLIFFIRFFYSCVKYYPKVLSPIPSKTAPVSVRVFLIILSFALSAHLLVVTSYNLVQLSAEELVEKFGLAPLLERGTSATVAAE